MKSRKNSYECNNANYKNGLMNTMSEINSKLLEATDKANNFIQEKSKNFLNTIDRKIEEYTNRNLNRFIDEFDYNHFSSSLKKLIKRKYMQHKSKVFKKLSDEDVVENWNYLFDGYKHDNKILKFVLENVDYFYMKKCKLWNIDNKTQIEYYKFKKFSF